MTTQHVSIDLETLGLGHDALILSIGAVKFDPHTGALGETFYQVIDVAKSVGGTPDASTIVWWMNQSQAARDAVFGPDVPKTSLPEALVDLSEWLGFNDSLPEGEYPDLCIWERGNKDCAWLEAAYKGVGYKLPWKYWMVGDQRRFCLFFPDYLPERAEELTAHNALHDAAFQAEQVISVFQYLGIQPLPEREKKAAPAEPQPGDIIDVELVEEGKADAEAGNTVSLEDVHKKWEQRSADREALELGDGYAADVQPKDAEADLVEHLQSIHQHNASE